MPVRIARRPRRDWIRTRSAVRAEPSLVFGPPEVADGQTLITVEEHGDHGYRPLGVITIDADGVNYHRVPNDRRAWPGAVLAAVVALIVIWRLRGHTEVKPSVSPLPWRRSHRGGSRAGR